MNAPSIPPSAAANTNDRTFSLAEYRAHNDRLEAKFPDTAAAHAAKRIDKLHREAREHLRRARKLGGRPELRLDALEGALEAVVAVSELRGAR
jgi:hypothetical protein